SPRPRRVPPAEPLAAALLDHHRDGRPRRVTALRADGVEFEIETEEYFTLEGELAPLDRLAVERARGRVLDVGAGSGRHALALQAKGCEVVAIDVSPACVLLCRERGVRDVRLVDVMTIGAGGDDVEDGSGEEWSEGRSAAVPVDHDLIRTRNADQDLGRFDTIFFGMQTIGVAGGVKPLRILLERLRGLLRPGGCVIADSSELREAWDGDASDRSPERGEIVLATRYGRLRGEPFAWVYLAEADLADVARAAGYTAETLMRVASGEYLVELRVADGAGSAASAAAPGKAAR
ncbi:methyltransferase domain-containing protein, partial [Myxococcota bacterium]|nr:methyltransferase domain-containing protein [Myxococcota bacterium]